MSKYTASLAGGRRFWVVVLCFAVANAGVWAGYIRWQTVHRHHLLEVTQFTPGDCATVIGRPALSWTFNLDLAPIDAKSPPPGRITPTMAGKWTSPDPRTLTFTPDVDFPKASPFQVELSGETLHSHDGFRLSAPFKATLQTQGLEVVETRQAEFDELDRVIVEMTFNDKVLPVDVQKHLSLRGSDGREIHFQPHGDAPGKKVRVITDPVTALVDNKASSPNLDVRISKGLAGSAGPLGLANDFARRLPIAVDLMATEVEAYFPSHDEPFIQVRFNNPVEAEAVRQVISIEPPTPFNIMFGYDGVNLKGAFQPGARYAVKISKPPAWVSGRHVPRPTSFSVLIPDRDAGLWFENEFGYLGAEGNRTVMAHVVNMTDVRATVTRVYDNNIVGWRNAKSHGYYAQDVEAFARPVSVRDFHLPSKKNEKQDLRLSIDDLLPAGEARDGVYRIALNNISREEPRPNWTNDQDDSDESNGYRYHYDRASTVLTLSDIGLSAKQGRDGVIVWATSLRTAKPLANVHLRLYSNKSQLLGEAVTEASGIAKITPMPAGPGEKAAVILADQSAVANGRVVEVRPKSTNQRNDEDAAANLPQDSGDAEHASAHQSAGTHNGSGLTWLDLQGNEITFSEVDTGGRPYLRNGYEAFLYTDRGVYRPGETVHLRAIVRGPDQSQPPRFPVRWQIRRPDLRDWKMQMAEIDPDGATAMDLVLPDDLPTGRWTAHVGLPGQAGTGAKFFGSVAFEIEDFMPQRMKVNVALDGVAEEKSHGNEVSRLAVNDDPIVAHVQADYLFGRPVTGRPATLVARLDPVPFQPKAFSEWTFGDVANTAEALGGGKITGRRSELPAADLDATGHARWELDVADLLENGQTEEGDEPSAKVKVKRHARHTDSHAAGKATDYTGPWRLSVTGSVTETGGRAITASRQIDVDQTPYYIGVHPRDTAPRPGVASTFDVRLISCDGSAAVADASLQFTLFRETWNSSFVFKDSHYRYESTRVLEAIAKEPQPVSVVKGRGEITVVPPNGGSYVLLIRDPKNQTTTSIGFYAGYGAWEDNISRQNPEKLDLVIQPTDIQAVIDDAVAAMLSDDLPAMFEAIDKSADVGRDGKIRIGQGAVAIVRSPFAGQLLLSIETDGVVSTKTLDMPTSHIAVPIDITDACRPGAYVTATVIRPIDPNAAWTVHRAIGVARIPVDNSDRKLAIMVAAPAEIRPLTALGVDLRVNDSAGNPVENAAVTVAAVDEGICRLTGFVTPDPFSYFMAKRSLGVRPADMFGQLMPEVAMAEKQSAVGGDDAGGSLHRSSPVSAKRVRPVALVSAVLHTDANGLAHADFATPQFVGQLRIMAVASKEKNFGSADADVLVRSPLLVQSSWPRFAAPGDKFTVPLTIFNNSSGAGEAEISVELTDAGGPLQFDDGGTRLTLPATTLAANGQSTVAFQIVALNRIGVAHARLIAKMNGEQYEETIELPIRPASPAVAVGGYVNATPTAPAIVEMPAGFLDGTSRFELRVSSAPQLNLPEGLDYLDRYPYGCVEQTTSTLFPLVYLNDIGQQIAPGLFAKDRVSDKVRSGMLRLLGMQTFDGGLAMWPGGREPWPWGSVYAAHFLVEAQSAGFDVPEGLRDPLMSYLHGIINRPQENAEAIELQAYASYVLSLAGKPPRAAMGQLSEVVKREEAGSARFHLAAAWLAAGRRDLAADLLPQAIPAPRAQRELGGNVGSAVRDRAILLSTLLAVDPQDPRIPDLAAQLAASGRAKEWRSTQDVSFAVMAIGRYLRYAKSLTPFETAEILLDGKTIASSLDGKPLLWTASSLKNDTSLKNLHDSNAIPPAGAKLQIKVTGAQGAAGQVAWLQTGVQTAPPPASDGGMTVRRMYLDEKGNALNAMRVHSGDLVQVELTISSAGPLDNLVVEDLLPAGLEIENPRLAGNAAGIVVKKHLAKKAADANAEDPAFTPARTDMRDDRLILLGKLSRGGPGQKYLYAARAVTVGKFVLPPVKAECMYDSAVNSVWGSGTFEVLPAENGKMAQARGLQ